MSDTSGRPATGMPQGTGGATAGVPSTGGATAAPVEATSTRTEPQAQPSLGTLMSDITEDLSTLMRQEVALAKAELAESGKNAGKGAGMLAGAGVAGHMMLVFLSVALWWALGALIDNWGWSALIVAVLWGIIAAVLASMGRKELKQVQGAPQTAETVKKIPNALKGNEEENR